MNKQIAILTINDYLNYGNRLQNYALQEVLRKFGEVTTLRGVDSVLSSKAYMVATIRYWMMMLKPGVSHAMAIRMRRSKAFTRNLVNDSKAILDVNGIHGKAGYHSDLVVIGSDQVWNYRWLDDDTFRMRLGLCSRDIPTISYAASIGVSSLTDDVQDIFREGVEYLKAISVREDKAKEIVESCSDRTATVVLDPTLLLSRDQWKIIASSKVTPKEQYVLTYFLGQPTDRQEKIIKDYADKHKLKICRMLDNRDVQRLSAGPAEFVDLFLHADMIFADSYHACCFSIIFNKQFKVFNREGSTSKKGINMNSRLETLFRVFGIHGFLSEDNLIPEINYSCVNKRHEELRVKSLKWLESAIVDATS